LTIATSSIKRLAPQCFRVAFFFTDKTINAFLDKEKNLFKTTFSFDGAAMLSLACSERDAMHPAFYKLAEVKPDAAKRNKSAFLAIPKTAVQSKNENEDIIGVLQAEFILPHRAKTLFLT
jgi:hypothetical protein